ncbi:GPS motif protein [Trinorchestia longiramus]|nr:GPS motif protein [Trinorchestia longiramus]
MGANSDSSNVKSITKLVSQELKTRSCHMTVGVVLLKPVLTSGGHSLNCMPDCILQDFLQVDRVDASFRPNYKEIPPIFHPCSEHNFSSRTILHSIIVWRVVGAQYLLICLVSCKQKQFSSDQITRWNLSFSKLSKKTRRQPGLLVAGLRICISLHVEKTVHKRNDSSCDSQHDPSAPPACPAATSCRYVLLSAAAAQQPDLYIKLDYITQMTSIMVRGAQVWPTDPPDAVCIEPTSGGSGECLGLNVEEEFLEFLITLTGVVYTLQGIAYSEGGTVVQGAGICVYVPWNLQAARTQTGWAAVQWDDRETNFIDLVEVEVDDVSANISSYNNWVGVYTDDATEIVLNMHNVMEDLTNTSFVFVLPDPASHVRSLPWQCNGDVWTSTCTSEECCVPATSDVYSNVQPVDYSIYYHTCTSNSSDSELVDLSLTVDITTSHGKVFFRYAVGRWTNEEDASYEDLYSSSSCYHRSALQLLKYQCEGRVDTCTVNLAIMTYAVDTEVVQECTPALRDRYLLHYSCMTGDNIICPEESVLWDKTSTCYSIVSSSPLSFVDARHACQQRGGDLLYAIADDEDQFQWIASQFGFSNEEEIWSMGSNSDFDRSLILNVPTEMITPSVFNANGSFPDVSTSTELRLGVCAKPGELKSSTTETESLACSGDDDVRVCGTNSTCEPREEALGEKSTLVAGGIMCSCPTSYYGPSCEYYDCSETKTTHSVFNKTVSSITPLELHAPDGYLLAVEFAQMGHGACASPSLLSLLQLRCNGRSSCQISAASLRLSGRSTCHRIVSDIHVWGRLSFVTSFTCSNDLQEIQGYTGCFSLTPSVSLSQEAKEYCNERGGDLSIFINDYSPCLLDYSDSFDVLMLPYEDPYYEFNLHVDDYAYLETIACGSSLQVRPTRGLCQFPVTPVYQSNNTSNATFHLDVGANGGRNLTVQWGSSIFEVPLNVCIITRGINEPEISSTLCKTPDLCDSSVTFYSVVTGVPHDVQASLNGELLWESSLLIPSSLSVVPSSTTSALIFWMESVYASVFEIQYGENTYDSSSIARHQVDVETDRSLVQFTVSLTGYEYENLHVNATVAQYTAGEECTLQVVWLACGWRVAGVWLACGWRVAGVWLVCGWCVAGVWLASGWCVADEPQNFTYTLAVAADKVMRVTYAAFVDDQTHCGLHSTLALLRFWCDGTDKCDIPQPNLLSYLRQVDGVEQDCTMTSPETQMNIHFYSDYTSMSSSDFEASLECSNQNFVAFQNMCYGVSPVASFVDARAWCLQRGGDLAFETSQVTYEWYLETFGDPTDPWVMGYTTATRPVMPLLPTGLVEPNKLGSSSTGPCSLISDCEDAPSLCVFAALASDVVLVAHFTSSECEQNFCFNGGTCWKLLNTTFMCDCLPNYFGDFCEEEDSEQRRFGVLEMEYSMTDVLHLDAPVPTSLYVEFAVLGSVPFSGGTQTIEGADPEQGCLAPLFLQVLRARCNGHRSCMISARDARSHITSECGPVVTPRFIVRYSFRLKVDECERGNPSSLTCSLQSSQPRGCFKATSSPNEDLKQTCLDDGGDLVYSDVSVDACLCDCIGEVSAVYAKDFSYWSSSNYSSRVYEYEDLSCSSPSLSSRALCVYPLTTSCPEDRPFMSVYPDYIFASSAAGVVTQDCPVDFDGTAIRLCGSNGLWITSPDLKNCSSLDLDKYKEELTSAGRNRTAAEILVSLSADIAESAALAPGDIYELSELLLQAQAENREDLETIQGLQEQQTISELMLNSTSQLSNTALNSTMSWIGLREAAVRAAVTALQVSVRESALQYAAFVSSSSTDIQLSALRTRIVSESTAYFYDKERRGFSSEDGRSSITLPDHFYGDCEEEETVRVVFAGYKTLICILNQLPCSNAPNTASPTKGVDLHEGSLVSEVLGADVWNCRKPWNESWFAEDSESMVVATFHHVSASATASPDEDSSDFPQYLYDLFKYPSDLLKTSSDLLKDPSHLQDPADLLKDSTELLKPNCVFWDGILESWSTRGCSVVYSDGSYTICQCDHLTNLAVIMDINGVINGTRAEPITEWMTIVGCSMSVVCLSITAVVLLVYKEIRHRGSNVVRANLCINLAVAEFVLLVGLDRTENDILCSIIAGCLQYFFLVTFAWSSLESFALYLRLVKVMGVNYSVPKEYFLYGYGAPLLLVVTTAGAAKGKGFGTKSYCWLDPETGIIWAFAGPLACILVVSGAGAVNAVAYVMTVMVMVENHKASMGRRNALTTSVSDTGRKSTETRRLSSKIYGSIGIFLYLCLTWIFGFFYTSEASAFMAVPFVLLNSLQGVIIFLTTVLKDDFIMNILAKKLRVEVKITSPAKNYKSR